MKESLRDSNDVRLEQESLCGHSSNTFLLMAVVTANHGNEAPDEPEVLEVVGVDGGSRVDLKTVVIFAGVFKQAVHGVQNLV